MHNVAAAFPLDQIVSAHEGGQNAAPAARWCCKSPERVDGALGATLASCQRRTSIQARRD